MLPNQPAALEPFLTEVRTFAAGPFTAALLKGDALSEAEREAVVEKMHEYTGLSADYLKAANLRVSEIAFAHELLTAQRKTVGRLDGRFVGPTMDPPEKYTDYDPQPAAISAAFAAAFLDYYHGDLKFGQGSTNTTNFSIGDQWKWTHKTANGEQPMVNSGVDLAEALVKDANLRVHRDEVLRGRPHDVRASAVDGENEARPRRVHRLNHAAGESLEPAQ
jgi:carboxypeptidase C (cathepsin A)